MDPPLLVEDLRPSDVLSLGHPDVRIAILDGPVDLAHPCFAGAGLSVIDALGNGPAGDGRMSRHGTHVASVVFGQPGTNVTGIAPACTGLVIPVFRDDERRRLSQLDLARAIEHAVDAGAHVINISGGELSPTGDADAMLERAIKRCARDNVLVAAAAGNDGCECLHVPAALPTVLAVGALDRTGRPLPSSNWGSAYHANGVLAPGEGLSGAVPGGGTAESSGTSFATPIVTGVAARLLGLQVARGQPPDPHGVAEAILRTRAAACQPSEALGCERYVGGVIDVPRAIAHVEAKGDTTVADVTTAQVEGAEVHVATADQQEEGSAGASLPEAGPAAVGAPATPVASAGSVRSSGGTDGAQAADVRAPGGHGVAASCSHEGVASSGGCACGDESGSSYVYALGSIGFDFRTEARRDTFRQLMPDVQRTDPRGGAGDDEPPIFVSPNPYDVFQLYDYLESRPSESTKLTWTLNLDLTPIYAVEAEVTYPEDIYKPLRDALRFQALPLDDQDFVARVSIPGTLTNRTVQLFSGQVVPVVVAQPRGLYMWNETALVNSVVDAVSRDRDDVDVDYVRKLVRTFLEKVYFQCRNLGQSPPDRALNFAATNAYQVASSIASGMLAGDMVPGAENELYTLDTIDVSKSPYCRMDSDCWDVRISFFNPVNDRRARSVYQFTIDVSDAMPVSLAPAHTYLAT